MNTNGTLDTTQPFIGTSRGFNDARNYVTYEQDARGNRVTYTLNDDNGLVSKVTSPAPAGVNSSTVETTYSYNDRNRCV